MDEEDTNTGEHDELEEKEDDVEIEEEVGIETKKKEHKEAI